MLERKFSFEIKQLLADHKEQGQGYPGLILVSRDGSVFSTQSGTIQTFVPYCHSSPCVITAVDFCERLFLATLHTDVNKTHFVSLFFKNTLELYKRVNLNEVFEFQ